MKNVEESEHVLKLFRENLEIMMLYDVVKGADTYTILLGFSAGTYMVNNYDVITLIVWGLIIWMVIFFVISISGGSVKNALTQPLLQLNQKERSIRTLVSKLSTVVIYLWCSAFFVGIFNFVNSIFIGFLIAFIFFSFFDYINDFAIQRQKELGIEFRA